MARSFSFGFTPIERVAIETIAEERPEVVVTLPQRLAPVLDALVWTSQGRLATEADVDDSAPPASRGVRRPDAG